MGNNQSNRTPVVGYDNTYVVFQKPMFADGTFRRVYKGKFSGDHRVDGKQCVVKVNKVPYSLDKKEFSWEADKRAYEKAQQMADLFNKKYQTNKPIAFLKPEFTAVDVKAATEFLGFEPCSQRKNNPKEVKVAVERYLEGKYEKFVSNAGIVKSKAMATPAAFCHFTYDESNGQILVCDLQGERTNTGYKLTDPSVHSSGPTLHHYGNSDLGKSGIVTFFRNHKCNALCRGLKIPSVVNCATGDEMELENIVSQISSRGDQDTMPTVQINNCDVSEDKFRKVQTNVQIEAVVCVVTD